MCSKERIDVFAEEMGDGAWVGFKYKFFQDLYYIDRFYEQVTIVGLLGSCY